MGKKVLVFRDGTEREITGETGKYWLCGDAKFRKLGSAILQVEERAGKQTEDAPEAKAEKKTASGKKKKKEAEE